MTINTVWKAAKRFVGRTDSGLMAKDDPISKENIDAMQRDIHAKLGKKPKFTSAGPAGW